MKTIVKLRQKNSKCLPGHVTLPNYTYRQISNLHAI